MTVVAERNHLDALLLAAVVEAESQFIPDAISPGGAVGLMQLLPSTGRDYGVRDLLDPFANLDAGSRYLCDLVSRFRGKLDLAVAAYNAGPEVVVRYGRVPPYRETQDFVRRVMERYQCHQQQAALGTRSASLLLERSIPPLSSGASGASGTAWISSTSAAAPPRPQRLSRPLAPFEEIARAR